MITNPFEGDKFHDQCGVFGVFGHDDAAALTALAGGLPPARRASRLNPVNALRAE